MKERNILVLVLLILGIGAFLVNLSVANGLEKYNKFSFFKSELNFNETIVTETLHFSPNMSYHTLYRFTQTNLFLRKNIDFQNYIYAISINCSKNIGYFRDINGNCADSNLAQISCPNYTQNNEFGCSSTNEYGFFSGKNYILNATYGLNAQNLFLINGIYYIKFIAYEKNNHPFLNTDNFLVSGAIRKSIYYPKEAVIVYIPQTNPLLTEFEIIQKDNFEFDSVSKFDTKLLVFSIIPFLSVLFFWLFFGKEIKHFDMPIERSYYPQTDRLPEDVALYFNPSFSKLKKEFCSTVLLSLYEKKAISVKIINKKTYIKLNSQSQKLNDFENGFMEILEKAEKLSIEKDTEGYFDLNKIMTDYKILNTVKEEFNTMLKKIKEDSKKYLINNGGSLCLVILTLNFLTALININSFPYWGAAYLIGFLFFSIIFVAVLNPSTSLFSKYKENYYEEYLHWQAYKKYMSHSFSIKEGGIKSIAIWNKILLYTTALGISKKVLKQLKNMGKVTEKDYLLYSGILTSSNNLYSTSAQSSATGFSGVSAGGIGGGGAGGR